MSPWFVSLCLILSWDFTGLAPADIEIDRSGTVWVLSATMPAVHRLDSLGGRETFEFADSGPYVGLALSPTGRWAVSSRSENTIALFDHRDILVEEIFMNTPGDLVFNDLDLWVVNTSTGNLVSPWNGIMARNCAGVDSRLAVRSGQVLVSGSRGVFLVAPGEPVRSLAGSGGACFTGDTVMVIPGVRLSASPSGDTVIQWGSGAPTTVE